MITLSDADSQIVFYAKNHFDTISGDPVEDVRRLVAWRAGIDNQHVSDRSIVIVLTALLAECGINLANPGFMEVVVCGPWYATDSSPLRNFVGAALGRLAVMPVLGPNGEVLVQLGPLNLKSLEKSNEN